MLFVKNYCVQPNPIIIWIQRHLLQLIIAGVILYILKDEFMRMFRTFGSKAKKVNKSTWLILFGIVGIITVLLIVYYVVYAVVYQGREQRCLNAMAGGPVRFGVNVITQTWNEHYKQNMNVLVRDCYWAAARGAAFPCGRTRDIATLQGISTTLETNVRWLEFDLFWKGKSPADVDAIPVFATGNDNEWSPSVLPFEKTNTMVTVRDAFQRIAEEAWRSTSLPLVICIDAKFVENGKLPNLSVEKRIAEAWMGAFHNHLAPSQYLNNKSPFSECALRNAMNRAFLIINWEPQRQELKEVVSDQVYQSNIKRPSSGIATLSMNHTDMEYGGIRSKVMDKSEEILYNKFHLTRAIYDTPQTVSNVTSMKSDMENMDAKPIWEYGIQVVPMYLQMGAESSPAMKAYHEMFQYGSIILKPAHLRYISQPPPPLEVQQQQLSLSGRTASDPSRPGWADMSY